MAFEFYDDIAFFWFFLTMLAVILIPYSMHMLTFLREKPPEAELEAGTSIGRKKWKQKEMEYEAGVKSRYRSWRFIIFVVLWSFLIYGIMQVGSYQHEEMVVFDPYKLLDIEPGATDRDVKKAYRKLSLKHHPDKNPGDEEAANMFMMLAKAEQTLLDEQTRKNWEEFGNPDGYQGTSVTIGLPSAMLKKENEMSILIIYFFLVVVIPPVAVGMWWKRTWNIHETGVLLESIHKFSAFIQAQAPTKFFVEILCTAGEFAPNYVPKHMFSVPMQKDCRRLHQELGDDIPKQRTRINYAGLGSLLLYAHLLRDTNSLCGDARAYLNLILAQCHKLMAVMLDIALAKTKNIEPIKNLMLLSQHIVQAVYFGESNLYQLPHLGPDEVGQLKRPRKGKDRVASCSDLIKVDKVARRELISGLSAKQWADIDHVCTVLPNLKMAVRYEVEDEKGIFEGDLVKVHIKLHRDAVEDEEEDAVLVEAADGEDGNDDQEEATVTLLGEDEESDDEELFEEARKKREERKRMKKISALPVHAPLFPEQKFERWLVLLVAPNGYVLDMQKVPTLREDQELTMLVLAHKGTMVFNIHALCDSYIGVDKEIELKIPVKAKPTAKPVDRIVLKDDDDEDDLIPDEEDEEEMPLWMTILDLVATFLLLSFIAFGLYTYFSQKPWWIATIQPRIEAVLEFISPVTDVLAPYFAPLKAMFDKYVAPHIYVEDHVPVYVDPSRAQHWQRAGIGAA